jgi:hypothetical protein
MQDGVYKPNTTQTICESQENVKLLKTLHVSGLAPKNYHNRNHHWRKEILLKVPNQENQIFPLNLHLTKL